MSDQHITVYSEKIAAVLAVLVLVALGAPERGQAQHQITVDAFTGAAIQEAVNEANDGDTIYLPAGVYEADRQIVVDKSVTVRGASELKEVAVPEWESEPKKVPATDARWGDMVVLENDPPYWESDPSVITYASDHDFDLLEVRANDVRFEHVKFLGAADTTYENMATRQNGIFVKGRNLFMENCEMTRFPQALTADVEGSSVIVRRSYFHENWRHGSAYGVRATYGGEADVRYSEFTDQRHDVVTSIETSRAVVVGNYFHNDSRVLGAYAVDIHPYGRWGGRLVVRNNIFRNTTGIVFHTGSGEVTGNYFGPYVDDWNPPILIGPRDVHKDVTDAHDIYVGHNVNKTGNDLISVRARTYDGETKWGAYNIYQDGELWESLHTEHRTYKTSPNPLLGHVFVTPPGGTEMLDTVQVGRWYDLHAMAVDPQGADDIARIGLQIVRTTEYAYRPGNKNGVFRADGNYFIGSDGETVDIRNTEGSGVWTRLPTSKPGDQAGKMYVSAGDSGRFLFEEDGTHRIHFVVRFRLLPAARTGDWTVFGYARDGDGHLPHSRFYGNQVGWSLHVTKD